MLRARILPAVAGAVLALPVPLIGGEWPDPSVINDGGGYTAVTTSNGWAPTFRILRSDDQRTWRIAGSVFRRAPRWARTDFFAPEIAKLGDHYVVFYSALPRRRKGSWYCLGVAAAPSPVGPYTDKGTPLRCNKYGSIDPFPVRDENGVLHLLWKEDGNEFRRPTPILAQQLSEDGMRLLGRPRELIRNGEPWEGRVTEAPAVIRHDGFFHLFYSANLCCTRRCAYAVGVARSPTLLGPWEKYPGNPILRGGNGWRCPGHTAVVPDAAGGFSAFFHAFRSGDGLLAGRQLLTDGVSFTADGWPRIGSGLPARPLAGAASTAFADSFRGPRLASEWEWLAERAPRIRVGNGLRLTAAASGGKRVDAAVIARRVGTPRYVASAVVDRRGLRGEALAGLASYRSGFEAIGGSGFEAMGAAVGARRLIVWRRARGRSRLITEVRAPSSRQVHLRLVSQGRRVRFQVSRDGRAWRRLGPALRTPIEETARLALTVGARRRAVARFTRASLR
ncbi:MAG: family 43 glycosylhydrolase, partial [Chloroflexota bacterium]|nr:family 43 glycosylhydrolase [Chloroflexota bacterium]